MRTVGVTPLLAELSANKELLLSQDKAKKTHRKKTKILN